MFFLVIWKNQEHEILQHAVFIDYSKHKTATNGVVSQRLRLRTMFFGLHILIQLRSDRLCPKRGTYIIVRVVVGQEILVGQEGYRHSGQKIRVNII